MDVGSYSVAKTANGKGWRGIIRYKDDAGRWRNTTRSLKGARNKTEAKRMLREMMGELEPASSAQPVLPYALVYVERKLALKAIQPATATDYRKSLNGWEPYLGGVALSGLTPRMLEDAIQDMLLDVGVTTVRKRYVALKMVLDHACRTKELRENPLASVPKPKPEPSVPNAIVGEDLDRLRARLPQLPLKPWVVGVHLCLYAGLRAEEVCGLQVGDIDLESGVGWVRRSVGYARGGSYVAPTKTRRSRDFPICGALHAVLAAWLGQRVGRPQDWLLGDRMPSVRSVGRMWSMLCEVEGYVGQAGKKPTLHDLRHTFATQCVAAGMDVKTLQSILGHSSAAMTLDIYASPDPAAKRAASAIIDSAI